MTQNNLLLIGNTGTEYSRYIFMITEPTPGTFLDISITRISVNANRNWYATDILQYSMLRIEIASTVQFTFHLEIKKKEEKRKLIRIYTSRFTFVSQSMYNISPLWLEVKRTECVKLTETQIRFSCWDESRYLSCLPISMIVKFHVVVWYRYFRISRDIRVWII